MTAIGDTLRRERLRRNLDLESVSRELKISPKMLSAIEEEKFDRLPGGVFAKAFVRQYARLLGLDEDELGGEVQRILQPSPEPSPAGREHRPLAAPIQLPRVETWGTIGDSRVRWNSPLMSLALVVVVMMGCAGVYTLWQRARAHRAVQQSQVKPVPSVVTPPPVRQSAAPVIPAAASTPTLPANPADSAAAKPVEPSEESKPAAAAPVQTSVAEGTAAQSNPNAAVRVELKATEPVWVSVRSDGKFVFSDTLQANQTRTVDANEKVVLRLGNAGGIEVTLNGKPIGALGPKGQIRTVQLTSGGFEIVAAPKGLSDPLDPLL